MTATPEVPPPQRPRPRLWPAVAVALIAAGATLYTWVTDGATSRQTRVMNTGAILVVALLVLVVWLLAFSRLRWRTRLASLAALGLVLFALSSVVRVRGVTGDLVPILGWRWSGPGGELVAAGGGEVRLSGRPEYPQFLGPNRDAMLPETRLVDWDEVPPVELWRREVGAGFSSFAVVGDLAVTQEQRGEDELVVAYDRDDGRIIWAHSDRARYSTAIAGTGPRSTPTVAGGAVFTVGATGIVNALGLADGEPRWSHDLVAEYGAVVPEWGLSGSPLVVDGRVVVSAGAPNASLIAFDALRGEVVWRAGGDGASYASPRLFDLAGVRQVVQFHQSSVAGYRWEDGRELWRHPWSAEQPNVAQPLRLPGDRLLVSSGYGIGSAMLRLRPAGDRIAVETLWESPRLKAKFAHPVLHADSVYGLDDGVLVCLDPATGERRWKRGRYGHGQLILVDDRLLIVGEKGDLSWVEADPERHVERARIEVFTSRTWNAPALAGDQLFLRNDREIAVYRVELRSGS